MLISATTAIAITGLTATGTAVSGIFIGMFGYRAYNGSYDSKTREQYKEAIETCQKAFGVAEKELENLTTAINGKNDLITENQNSLESIKEQVATVKTTMKTLHDAHTAANKKIDELNKKLTIFDKTIKKYEKLIANQKGIGKKKKEVENMEDGNNKKSAHPSSAKNSMFFDSNKQSKPTHSPERNASGEHKAMV